MYIEFEVVVSFVSTDPHTTDIFLTHLDFASRVEIMAEIFPV